MTISRGLVAPSSRGSTTGTSARRLLVRIYCGAFYDDCLLIPVQAVGKPLAVTTTPVTRSGGAKRADRLA